MEDVYVRMPKGFKKKEKFANWKDPSMDTSISKEIDSLNISKQTWFKRESPNCLQTYLSFYFWRVDFSCLSLCYKEIDKRLNRLTELEIDLNVEDDVAWFLRVIIKILNETK